MARTFYDSLGLNEDIQLDLSMLEATGAYLHDESRNHSMASMNSTLGTPLWQQIAAWHHGIYLNRAYPLIDMRQYYDIPAADCPNLDFTATDYSLAMWFNWGFLGYSQILIGKYAVDARGWEVYLHDDGPRDILTVRHHHGGTRTATYSLGWTQHVWHLWGYTRIGALAYHYRDGEAITTIGGPLLDPNSSAADDVRIGCRFTEDQNWFKGKFHRPRAWSRALSAAEHRLLYRLGYP